MLGRSPLTKALEAWIEKGGDLGGLLSPVRGETVNTRREARAVCTALETLRTEPSRMTPEVYPSPLHRLTGLFEEVGSRRAFESLKAHGLPHLRSWIRDALGESELEPETALGILHVLASYRQKEDVALIAAAARKPIKPDSYMWWLLFSRFNENHSHAKDMAEALRDPLPPSFISVAYLDMAHRLADAGMLHQHPFDSEPGRRRLEDWLRSTDEEVFSYAHSAAAALPFIDPSSRKRLLEIADNQRDPTLRIAIAAARAKSGESVGLDRLAEMCLDPCSAQAAIAHLEALGRGGLVPDAARQPDFQALSEMANWLRHPTEFGRPPDHIRLYDTTEIYWPPTEDRRRVWLVEYTYNDGHDGGPDRGVGMVGSVTFALFGAPTADLSPEDIYGLHCCFELREDEDAFDPRARKLSAEEGRAILREHNAGF